MIVELLHERGFLVNTEDHDHAVGKCYRCKTVVEPFLSPQWFVRTGPLAEPAINAVEKGSIRFVPKGWENTYYDWMRNIKDWCISRQIWWGHRIPAWYCRSCDPGIIEAPVPCRAGGVGGTAGATGGSIVTIAINARPIIQREPPRSCPRCGSSSILQDPDVLDTWFSSALWPFSTLGWPERTKDLAVYYPTSVLVTSFDIIFFWVARMIMMGLHFMGEIPFRDVYIHALVRDAEGQKMSKSKGNVIDPLEMTERYGTDAFRFTLAAFAAQGRDIKMSAERIEGYRNFANKLWNASRFVMMNLEPGFTPHDAFLSPCSTLADRWIASRMNTVVGELRRALEQYAFNEAASTLYQFIWHEYCDWYVELAKPSLAQQDDPGVRRSTQTTLARVLETTLRMLHPIMPFITEELWQKLPAELRPERAPGSGVSIMTAAFPEPQPSLADPAAEQDMQLVMDLILAVRNIRGVMGIPPSVQLEVIVKTESEEAASPLERNGHYVKTLARAGSLRIGKHETKPRTAATGVIRGAEVYVPLEGVLDLAEERGRLAKEIAKTSQDIALFSKKLSNPNFVEKAPKAVVEKDTARLEELKIMRSKLEDSLRMLGA
jgi:valyl-tRNA synthetase